MKQQIAHLVLAAAALSLTACGQNMTSTSSAGAAKTAAPGVEAPVGGSDNSDTGSLSSPVGFDYEAFQKSALEEASAVEEEAEVAVAEAEKALNKISLNSGGMTFGNSGDLDQQLIVDKLVKKILDKVVQGLEAVPEKFNSLRAKLVDKMSSLDASNPLHQMAISALMVAMEKIDQVEARYKDLLAMVADKVDLVGGALDGLAAAIPFPANLLVQFELASVKAVLAGFQSQLRSL